MQVSARDIIYNTYTPVGFISNTYSHSLSFGMLCVCVYSQQNLSISRIAVCDMMNVNCKYYALNLIVAVCWEKNFPATFHKVRRGMKENEIPWRKSCAHKTLLEDCEGGGERKVRQRLECRFVLMIFSLRRLSPPLTEKFVHFRFTSSPSHPQKNRK